MSIASSVAASTCALRASGVVRPSAGRLPAKDVVVTGAAGCPAGGPLCARAPGTIGQLADVRTLAKIAIRQLFIQIAVFRRLNAHRGGAHASPAGRPANR